MIPFAVYTAAEIPHAFQWATQTPKIAAFPGRILTHILYSVHGSLRPHESATNGISIGIVK